MSLFLVLILAMATLLGRLRIVARITLVSVLAVGIASQAGVVFSYDASPTLVTSDASRAAASAAPNQLSDGEQIGRNPALGSPAASRGSQVAANAGTSLVGKSYGLGTVVENPGLVIKGFQGSKTPGHALNQIINRGVSPSMLRNTVASPKVVLRQGSGNYLHLSDEAAVVLRPDGQVVTAYGRTDFRQHILDILADVG